MSNHGYVTSGRIFKSDEVNSAINEINQRRFGNKLTIEHDKHGWFVGCKIFNKGYDIKKKSKVKYEMGFDLWIETKRKLEFQHNIDDFVWYVESVFINELAHKYNGMISDDGVDEKWKPDLTKYKSYRQYLACRSASYGKINKPAYFAAKMVERISYSMVPKEMRKY